MMILWYVMFSLKGSDNFGGVELLSVVCTRHANC